MQHWFLSPALLKPLKHLEDKDERPPRRERKSPTGATDNSALPSSLLWPKMFKVEKEGKLNIRFSEQCV